MHSKPGLRAKEGLQEAVKGCYGYKGQLDSSLKKPKIWHGQPCSHPIIQYRLLPAFPRFAVSFTCRMTDRFLFLLFLSMAIAYIYTTLV